MQASSGVDSPPAPLKWDQHGCLQLRPEPSIDGLSCWEEAGVDFVSVNVGFDAMSWEESMHALACFRREILAEPDRFLLVDGADDVALARESGRLAVSFDLEGTVALDGDAAMVEAYHHLGVRTMLIAYNYANKAGGGCHDEADTGLTPFGREVVSEMNRVGMLVDATHCSVQTTLDLFACSETPVIFSHSVPAGDFDHQRNISDEQMRNCAAGGGVIGINGVGLFLGDSEASSEAIFRAIEYAVEVVGPNHVGLGLDYVVSQAEIDYWVEKHKETFPSEGGYGAGMTFAPPSQIDELIRLMRAAGYPESDVSAIAGENFLRVAKAAWRG